MPQSKKESFYILGAPFFGRDEKIQEYSTAFRTRFKDTTRGEDGVSDQGVEFLYRGFDRLINMARGLLTFNALLFASYGVFSKDLPAGVIPRALLIACGALPLLASVFLLSLFWMTWGPVESYENNDNDAAFMLAEIRRGTRAVGISMWLTITEMVLMTVAITLGLH